MWKHKHSHGEKRNMQLFARDAWFVCHENIYTHFNLMSLSHTHTHTEKKEVTTTEWRQKWLLHNATPTTKKKKHRRSQRIQMAKTTYDRPLAYEMKKKTRPKIYHSLPLAKINNMEKYARKWILKDSIYYIIKEVERRRRLRRWDRIYDMNHYTCVNSHSNYYNCN